MFLISIKNTIQILAPSGEKLKNILQSNDEILKINGQEIRNKSQWEIFALLKRLRRQQSNEKIFLEIKRGPQVQTVSI